MYVIVLCDGFVVGCVCVWMCVIDGVCVCVCWMLFWCVGCGVG